MSEPNCEECYYSYEKDWQGLSGEVYTDLMCRINNCFVYSVLHAVERKKCKCESFMTEEEGELVNKEW